MDLFNTIENTSGSEQQSPIFLLSVSFTDIQLKIDTNQLNLLNAWAKEASPEAMRCLTNIRDEFKQTNDNVTSMFKKLLKEIFGEDDVICESLSDISESTIFFIGGENDESETNGSFEESN